MPCLIPHECESLSPGITNLRATKPTVHFPTHSLATGCKGPRNNISNMVTVVGGHGA